MEIKSRAEVRCILSSLHSIMQVIPVDEPLLQQAPLSEVDDYKNAILEAAAITHPNSLIVTRKVKAFRHSSIEGVSPVLFLELIGP